MKLQKLKRKFLKLKAKVNLSFYNFETEMLQLKNLDYVERIRFATYLTEKYIKPLNRLLDRFTDKSWYNKYSLISSHIHKSIYKEGFSNTDKETAWEVYDLFKETSDEILQISGKMVEIILPFLSTKSTCRNVTGNGGDQPARDRQ